MQPPGSTVLACACVELAIYDTHYGERSVISQRVQPPGGTVLACACTKLATCDTHYDERSISSLRVQLPGSSVLACASMHQACYGIHDDASSRQEGTSMTAGTAKVHNWPLQAKNHIGN